MEAFSRINENKQLKILYRELKFSMSGKLPAPFLATDMAFFKIPVPGRVSQH